MAVFTADHRHATIYSPPRDGEWVAKDGWHSLSLFPTDQIWLGPLLADRSAVLMHSGAAVVDGQGLVFIGHSSAGKSTTMELLKASPDVKATILCDDRNVIRKWPEGWRVHGTWSHGTTADVSPAEAPLKAILFLEQDTRNELVPLTDRKEIVRQAAGLGCLQVRYTGGAAPARRLHGDLPWHQAPRSPRLGLHERLPCDGGARRALPEVPAARHRGDGLRRHPRDVRGGHPPPRLVPRLHARARPPLRERRPGAAEGDGDPVEPSRAAGDRRLLPGADEGLLPLRPADPPALRRRRGEERRDPTTSSTAARGAGNGSFNVSYDGRFRLCSSLWADGTTYDLRKGTLADAWVNFVPEVRDLRSQRREFLDSCRRGPTAEPAGATNFQVSCAYRVVRTGQTQTLTLTLTKAPYTFNDGGDAKSREVTLRH